MLIKDIPYPKVREAAIAYIRKQFTTVGYQHGDQVGHIIWHETAEGSVFWRDVNFKNWDHAKELCPHLFEADPITTKYDLSSMPTDELEEWLNAANKEMGKRQSTKKFKVIATRWASSEVAVIYINGYIDQNAVVTIQGDLYLVRSCEEVEQ